jgi:hypothetical protein
MKILLAASLLLPFSAAGEGFVEAVETAQITGLENTIRPGRQTARGSFSSPLATGQTPTFTSCRPTAPGSRS